MFNYDEDIFADPDIFMNWLFADDVAPAPASAPVQPPPPPPPPRMATDTTTTFDFMTASTHVNPCPFAPRHVAQTTNNVSCTDTIASSTNPVASSTNPVASSTNPVASSTNPVMHSTALFNQSDTNPVPAFNPVPVNLERSVQVESNPLTDEQDSESSSDDEMEDSELIMSPRTLAVESMEIEPITSP